MLGRDDHLVQIASRQTVSCQRKLVLFSKWMTDQKKYPVAVLHYGLLRQLSDEKWVLGRWIPPPHTWIWWIKKDVSALYFEELMTKPAICLWCPWKLKVFLCLPVTYVTYVTYLDDILSTQTGEMHQWSIDDGPVKKSLKYNKAADLSDETVSNSSFDDITLTYCETFHI